MARWQDLILDLLPFWLSGSFAKRFFRSAVTPADIITDGIKEGVKARFVKIAPDDALDEIGSERNIERYPNETLASYRVRLAEAWETWMHAGHESSIENQFLVFAGLTNVRTYAHRIIGNPVTPYNWQPDQNSTAWSRFSHVIDQPMPWSDLIAGPEIIAGPEVISGTTMTASEYRIMRRIVHKWRPAHALGVMLTLVFDGVIASPDTIAGPALFAGCTKTDLPIGRFFNYGFGFNAGPGTTCGYYLPGDN